MIYVDLSTICRFLQISGFSHQKMLQVAIQQDYCSRHKYLLDISVYSPEMLIFLDETGADRRNYLRKFSYSVRGIPARQHAMFVRGQRVSAIAMMSIKGIIDVFITTSTVNGQKGILFHTYSHLMGQILTVWLSWIIVPSIMFLKFVK